MLDCVVGVIVWRAAMESRGTSVLVQKTMVLVVQARNEQVYYLCCIVDVQAHQFLQSHELRLVCNGYYPEIHIIHPRRLEILFSLSAQIQPDWVTALCVLRPVNREGIYLYSTFEALTCQVPAIQ